MKVATTERFRPIITGIEENMVDICEFLMVDKKNPKMFYCRLAKREIDVAFNPCVLPAEDRITLCPFYRDHWFKTSIKKA
jgi:predicted solute-binding protein